MEPGARLKLRYHLIEVGLGDHELAPGLDLCIERAAAGEGPACVTSCPTGALQLCEVQEWASQRRSMAAKRATADLKQQGRIASEMEDEAEKG